MPSSLQSDERNDTRNTTPNLRANDAIVAMAWRFHVARTVHRCACVHVSSCTDDHPFCHDGRSSVHRIASDVARSIDVVRAPLSPPVMVDNAGERETAIWHADADRRRLSDSRDGSSVLIR